METKDLPRCVCGENSGLFVTYGVYRCPACLIAERDILLDALRPFAAMARPDDDPVELACQRGVGVDMTAIFSQDFTAAAEATLGMDPNARTRADFVELLSTAPDATTIQQCCLCYGGNSFPGPMRDALMCHIAILRGRLQASRKGK
jgi:hypothetical protein